MLQDITFITAPFRDFEWTRLLVESICQNTPSESINEIIIVDQDRSEESRSRLQTLNSKVRVVQYPKSEAHFLKAKHDHAAVLNVAVREAKGKFILIFDSDAHPITTNYLEVIEEKFQSYDAILAEDIYCSGLTHPCFMVLKQKHIELNLAFDKGFFETPLDENGMFNKYVDTGRLIGQQLKDAGERVYICPAKYAFSGDYGTIYLGITYHHGHGSFKKNESEILQKQVGWECDYFREYVINRRQYTLPFFHLTKFRILKFFKNLPYLPTRILLKLKKAKNKFEEFSSSF